VVHEGIDRSSVVRSLKDAFGRVHVSSWHSSKPLAENIIKVLSYSGLSRPAISEIDSNGPNKVRDYVRSIMALRTENDRIGSRRLRIRINLQSPWKLKRKDILIHSKTGEIRYIRGLLDARIKSNRIEVATLVGVTSLLSEPVSASIGSKAILSASASIRAGPD
jgi:hypothetical protein